MTIGRTPSIPSNGRPTVLVVDDSPVDRRLVAGLIEKELGCRAVSFGNGTAALGAMESEQPSVVITDLLMPDMDGLRLIQALRANYPQVPIVIMTGHGSEAVAIRALQHGAASYVPKASLQRDLTETVEQVLVAAQKYRQHQRLQDCIAYREYHFVLENDRTLIPPLISFLQEHLTRFHLCDETGRIRIGVALEEALLNALYHGNLELGSELRQQGEEFFQKLVEDRRQQEPYHHRRIHCRAALSAEEAVFVIRDEGPGFNPAELPDPTDPVNLEKTTGRGVLLIRTFMDELSYNETGNQLTMIKRRPLQKGP